VIHTVGPVWSGGRRGEESLLASAYRRSLEIAAERGLRSVAFPSISTGAYRFPIPLAARIAIGTVRDFLTNAKRSIEEVRFVLFSDDDLETYRRAAIEVLD
jgi:O-acetyl-ADP-ribose deacetylase (regulator of RNase III)